MNRRQLARRLRWLAEEWEKASPRTRARIEKAFRRGLERGIRVGA